MIDVSNIKPAALLAGLYNNSFAQGMGLLRFKPGCLSIDQAQKLLDDCRVLRAPDGSDGVYFDYLQGRVLKVWIGPKKLDDRLYDRDLGPGAAARVVETLRTQPEALIENATLSQVVDF